MSEGEGQQSQLKITKEPGGRVGQVVSKGQELPAIKIPEKTNGQGVISRIKERFKGQKPAQPEKVLTPPRVDSPTNIGRRQFLQSMFRLGAAATIGKVGLGEALATAKSRETENNNPESAEDASTVRISVVFDVQDVTVDKNVPTPSYEKDTAGTKPIDYLYGQQKWENPLSINRDWRPLVGENGESLRSPVRIVTFGFGGPEPSSAPVAREVSVLPTEMIKTTYLGVSNDEIDKSGPSLSSIQLLAAKNNNGATSPFYESGGSSIIGSSEGGEDTKVDLTTVAVNEGNSIVNKRIEDGLRQMLIKKTQEVGSRTNIPWVIVMPQSADTNGTITSLMSQLKELKVKFVVHNHASQQNTGTNATSATVTVGGHAVNQDGSSTLVGSTGSEMLTAPDALPYVNYAGGTATNINSNFPSQAGALVAGMVAEALQIYPDFTDQQISDGLILTARQLVVGGVSRRIPDHTAARAHFIARARELSASGGGGGEGGGQSGTNHTVTLPLITR